MTTLPTPDTTATLTLTDSYHAEVARHGADLHFAVDLWGLGRPSGRRVQELRDALAAAEVPQDHVSVEALSRERWGLVALVPLGMLLVPFGFVFGWGALLWGVAGVMALALFLHLVGTPSGLAVLRVRCTNPEAVRRVVDATLQLPSVTLRSIDWMPASDARAVQEVDTAALSHVRARADAIAMQQGMRVASVRSFELSAEAPPMPPPSFAAPMSASRERASLGAAVLGASPGTQRTQVHVRVVFILDAA